MNSSTSFALLHSGFPPHTICIACNQLSIGRSPKMSIRVNLVLKIYILHKVINCFPLLCPEVYSFKRGPCYTVSLPRGTVIHHCSKWGPHNPLSLSKMNTLSTMSAKKTTLSTMSAKKTTLSTIPPNEYHIIYHHSQWIPHYPPSLPMNTTLSTITPNEYHIIYHHSQWIPHYPPSLPMNTTLSIITPNEYHITYRHSQWIPHYLPSLPMNTTLSTKQSRGTWT